MVFIKETCSFLNRLGFIGENDYFDLIINGTTIKVRKISLICSSKLIYEKYILNKSLNSYNFDIYLSDNSCLKILKDFLNRGEIEIDDKSNSFLDLFHIASKLKIDSILKLYIKNVQVSDDISLKNINSFYENAVLAGDTKKQDECIDLIAKNFHKLDQSALQLLMLHHGFDFCERILTNNLLQVSSEDDLCSLIVDICQKNHDYADLLQCVHLELCKPETKDKLYNFGRDNNLQSVIYEVFYKIIRENKRKPLEISEQFYQNVDTISELPDIIMKSSSAQVENPSTINKPNSDFVTLNEKMSWVEIDLNGRKLQLNKYKIRSRIVNFTHILQNWELIGIDSKGNEVIIDRKNEFQLDSHNPTSFYVDPKGFFSRFKLVQTGPNSKGTYHLALTVFDLGGQII